MKKTALLFMMSLLLSVVASSCFDNDNNWKDYAEWRELNEQWLEEQRNRIDANGDPYFKEVRAEWDGNAYVLMHFFNDTTLTRDNLSPLYTSTVDVKYIGYLCTGEAFDSSYLKTDSVLRMTLTEGNSIEGWSLALQNMHVGDTCEVIIPYGLAYGTSGYLDIDPYSVLRYNMRLVSVPGYEKEP